MKTNSQINFYRILNISPLASLKEIKAAYVKKVQIYHPDKNGGNQIAKKKFQEVYQAWEVLKDPKQKLLFDKQLQSKRLKQAQKNVHLSSLIKLKTQNLKEEAIDLEVEMLVSIEDLCQLRTKNLSYIRSVNGKKIKKSFQFNLFSGIKLGSKLRFKQEGSAAGIQKYGDLYVKILAKKHNIFQMYTNKQAYDLFLERPISFVDALCSDQVEIPSPYGFLAINIQKKLKNEDVFKIKNHGLPKLETEQKGHLFVKIIIDYPLKQRIKIQQQLQKLSPLQQKQLAQQMQKKNYVYPKVLKYEKIIQELKNKEFIK